jgi:hypothetical protein
MRSVQPAQLFKKIFLTASLLLGFGLLSQAQIWTSFNYNAHTKLNPLFVSTFKKQVKPVPGLNERFKTPNNQLMSWPNYPLTAAQITYRDRQYDQSVGQQIISDVAGSYINAILSGKNKKPVVVSPKTTYTILKSHWYCIPAILLFTGYRKGDLA